MKGKYLCVILALWFALAGCSKNDGGAGAANAVPLQEQSPAKEETAQTVGDYKITVADGEVTITGYKGTAKDVVIPPTINGMPVTAIGERAFIFNKLTSVTIGSNVWLARDFTDQGIKGEYTVPAASFGNGFIEYYESLDYDAGTWTYVLRDDQWSREE
jgi:hypothetical protein